MRTNKPIEMERLLRESSTIIEVNKPKTPQNTEKPLTKIFGHPKNSAMLP